jgi:outer membrane protein TolC
MRRFFVFLLVISSFTSSAQSLVDSISSTGFSLNESIAEKLSTLAVNNRKVDIAEKTVQSSKLEVGKAKATWFNNLTFASNFNEYSINGSLQGQQNFFFPRYNLSLSLPFGYFFTQSKEVKIAKATFEKSKIAKQTEIEDIKQSIKIQYETYLANKYFLALHETLLQDQKILVDKVEASFENNQVDLDVFSTATMSFNEVLVKKINLIKDLNASKYQLENLLGMKLEAAYRKIGL